ncbi:MAG TPA: CHAD domain-containing protein [Phnomibacter sp.]|nr:CHAD domain-containing protein [Phnomibacter sp.]
MAVASHYIKQITEGVLQCLHRGPDREMLHQLRVHIKKLRALWSIHPLGTDLPFKTTFPAMRSLFKLAADTRDIQMMRNCLRSLPAYLKMDQLDKELKRKVTLGKKKIRIELKKKKFRNAVLKDIYRYRGYYKMAARFLLGEKRKEMHNKFMNLISGYTHTSDAILHDLRRQIKSTIYRSEAFPGQNGHQPRQLSPTTMDHLQHHIGIWHDWWNAVDWLQKHRPENTDADYDQLLQQAKRKENMLKREILRELKLAMPKPSRH